jgi:predicted outer membrane protein
MRTRTLLFACALAGSPLATADPVVRSSPIDEFAKLSEVDTQIIARLHAVNQRSVEIGTFAQEQGTAGVKAYGQTLVADRRAFDDKLVELAQHHGLSKIPDDDSLTPGAKFEMDTETGKLSKLDGMSFDRVLLQLVTKADDDELTKLEANIAMVTDPALKSLLEEFRPTLEKNADAARRLQRAFP